MIKTEFYDFDRIFLLSDLHFGIKSNSLEWFENQMDYFYNFYIPYIEENKTNKSILVICGDTFDNKELIDIFVQNKVVDLFVQISKMLPIYFILGNHDIYKRDDVDINSLDVSFSRIKNVNIINNNLILNSSNKKVLMLSWNVNYAELRDIIEKESPDYAFCHSNILGFKNDNMTSITHGIDLKNIKNTLIFSGHIHKRQGSNNIIYLGSPYHTKRSDIGNRKGVYYIDTLNDRVDFKYNDYSPIFQKINNKDVIKLLKENNINELVNIFNNNYTDIVTTFSELKDFDFQKFVKFLNDNGCQYKQIEMEMVGDNITNTVVDVKTNNNQNIESIINEAIEKLTVNDNVKFKLKEINKNFLLSIN